MASLPHRGSSIHEHPDRVLAPAGLARHASLATIVIQGDLSTSYRIAMGIALRQLAA